MTLRDYVASDLDAMHTLDVVCFEPAFRFTRSAMRRFAEARKARVTIAETQEELAGFCILHCENAQAMRTGYIVTLDVAPAHRRTGLARRLIDRAEQQAAAAACAVLILHVFSGNAAAIAFYESLGFQQSHREDGFYGEDLDAFVYLRHVPAGCATRMR